MNSETRRDGREDPAAEAGRTPGPRAGRAPFCSFKVLACIAFATPIALSAGCLSGDGELLAADGTPRKGDAPAMGAEDPLGDEDEGGAGRRPSFAAPGGGRTGTGSAGGAGAESLPPALLPLPPTRTFYGVKTFLDDYRDAHRALAPFAEYRTYARTLTGTSDTEGPEFEPLRARIDENYARSHWAFVSGAHELLDFIANRSRDMLGIDKEKNVLARFRTLSFLAERLDSATGGTRYRDWTREMYAEISERHFGRKVRRRGVGDARGGSGGGSGPARDVGAEPQLD